MSKNTTATTATTIKLTKDQKTMSYHAYNAVLFAIQSVANFQPDMDAKVKTASDKLSALVESVHGEKVNGEALFYNILIRHASYKTRRADNYKHVKLNGIATFNKWVKEYKPEVTLDVVGNAGKNPTDTKKKEAMPTNKEVAFNILKNLPEEERMKLVEALLAA